MPHTRFEKILLDANQEHDREIPSKTGFADEGGPFAF